MSSAGADLANRKLTGFKAIGPMDSPTRDEPTSPTSDSLQFATGNRVRKIVSLAVLAGVCLAFAAVFYQLIRPMTLPLFLAAVFAMLAFPQHERLTRYCGGRSWLSALLIPSLLLVVLVVPMIAGFFTSYQRAVDAVDLFQRSAFDPSKSDELLNRVARYTHTDPKFIYSQMIQAVRDGERLLFQRAFQAVGDFFSFGLSLLLFLVALFFFLKDGQSIVKAWDELTPLDLEQDRKIRKRFAVVCRGVVLSTIMAAGAQALAVGGCLVLINLGFKLDLEKWIPLMVVLTAVGAMIPMLGATAVWLPLSIWLLYQHQYAAGIILMIYGSVVVSNVDNLVRMRVLRGAAGMHPLLTLISVLGGVEMMGVIGAFIGPIVAGVFIVLLLILKQQLDDIEGLPPHSPYADPTSIDQVTP
jgi:predicted PurR-regulated permease PerM